MRYPGRAEIIALRLTSDTAVRVDLDRLRAGVRSPVRYRDDTRFHQLQSFEEPGELLRAAQVVRHRAALVVALLRLVERRVGAGAVVHREVAARWHPRDQSPDHRVCL